MFPTRRFDFRWLVGLLLIHVVALIASIALAQSSPQENAVQILFIHHSCGGQLLADTGSESYADAALQTRCIYSAHPNGGGLRSELEAAGYVVNEASYGSLIGEDTDIHHWHAKFRDQMDRILTTRRQDELLPAGQTNRVVAFKSCYPNNNFVGEGHEPGDPDDPQLTIANAKAAYRSLLPFFAEHPAVLFVAMTAPPRAEPIPQGFRARISRWLKGAPRDGALARQFNTWLADPDVGWLADYTGGNVRVFNYFKILTDDRASGWSAYPTGNGQNSHPSTTGNTKAATAFVAFLEKALSHN